MKTTLTALLLVFLTLNLFSQSKPYFERIDHIGKDISISQGAPVRLWGQSKYYTTKLEYGKVFGIFIHGNDSHLATKEDLWRTHMNKNIFGIGYMPIKFHWSSMSLSGGAMMLNKRFPFDKYGAYFNFTIDFNIKINDVISIGYNHTSNGFKLFQGYNPGLDNIFVKLI